jgi:anti-sigma B factor antagonist
MQDVVLRLPEDKTVDFPVQLIKKGMEFLEKTATGELVLDLADCRAINSRTIGAIVNLTNRFSKNKRAFVLRNVNDHIQKVFDFMNLTPFLIIEEGGAVRAAMDAPQEAEPRPALKVDFEVVKGVGIYKFSGTIDSSQESGMFLNIINKIIADKNRMLIDMGGITYVDSLGVGVIIRLIKLMRDGKADVRFFGAGAALRKILELNSLDAVIRIHQTMEEALKDWA